MQLASHCKCYPKLCHKTLHKTLCYLKFITIDLHTVFLESTVWQNPHTYSRSNTRFIKVVIFYQLQKISSSQGCNILSVSLPDECFKSKSCKPFNCTCNSDGDGNKQVYYLELKTNLNSRKRLFIHPHDTENVLY